MLEPEGETVRWTTIRDTVVLATAPALFAQVCHMAVRNDFLAGFAGNLAALERGMKAPYGNPQAHAEAMVWHGTGTFFLSREAAKRGDYPKSAGMYRKGLEELAAAVVTRGQSLGGRRDLQMSGSGPRAWIGSCLALPGGSMGNSLRFVVLFLVLVVGLPAGTVTVNLNPPSMPVSAGQMLSTEVDLAGLGTPPSVGFDLTVAYNASLLSFESVTFGLQLGDPGWARR
jgi:hypothetical protein